MILHCAFLRWLAGNALHLKQDINMNPKKPWVMKGSQGQL